MWGNATQSSVLTPGAGIGWRAPHYQPLLEQLPALAFIEVHPENYVGGGIHRRTLEKARSHYPISFHCVGLSLGSAEGINQEHLKEVKQLADIIEPAVISDHISWSLSGNAHLNDLLPLPYDSETLDILCKNIECVQDFLKRPILVENPSTYLEFSQSTMSEQDFMVAVAGRTGCGLLLDVNNIYVQSMNHGLNTRNYIDAIPKDLVHEIHLAGHTLREFNEGSLHIDTHNQRVCPEVWELYTYAIQQLGPKPTLIEWDADFPTFETLLSEATIANGIMEKERLHAAA